jgi:predicted Zn-dependent protease
MEADFPWARRVLGAALLAAGDAGGAVRELEASAEANGDNQIGLAWLAHAKAAAGSRREAEEIVARLDATAGSAHVPGYHLALAHLGLGNHDAAFARLARAAAERDPALIYVAVEPRIAPLRRDKRYAELIAEMRLG